jgi:glycosidase
MYQIYVRSFKDSNGDGNGDIKGIISKIDYLEKSLGVEALVLSPIFKLSQQTKKEPSDFDNLDAIYGTDADFEELVKLKDERKLKLVLDLDPTVTSIIHPWFLASKNGSEKYNNYYIWGGQPEQDHAKEWQYDPDRKQYYRSLAKVVDSAILNLRNLDVQEEFRRILKLWVKKGVDGIRITDIRSMIKDTNITEAEADVEIAAILENWRQHLRKVNPKSALLGNVNGPPAVLATYTGEPLRRVLDLPITTALVNNGTWTGNTLKDAIEGVQKAAGEWPVDTKPGGPWTGWLQGWEYSKRLVERVGNARDIGNLFVSLLVGRGNPLLYQGDETGSRGSAHRVMNWRDNFTSKASPWYTDYSTTNYRAPVIEDELENEESVLYIVRKLIELRKTEKETVLLGVTEYPVLDDQRFAMSRRHPGSNGLLLLFNMGSAQANFDLETNVNKYLPGHGKVLITSKKTGDIKAGSHVDLTKRIPLDAAQAIVIEYAPITEE